VPRTSRQTRSKIVPSRERASASSTMPALSNVAPIWWGVSRKRTLPSRTTIGSRMRARMVAVTRSLASARLMPPTSTPPTRTPSAIVSALDWSNA
jgi:hypothetical protein